MKGPTQNEEQGQQQQPWALPSTQSAHTHAGGGGGVGGARCGAAPISVTELSWVSQARSCISCRELNLSGEYIARVHHECDDQAPYMGARATDFLFAPEALHTRTAGIAPPGEGDSTKTRHPHGSCFVQWSAQLLDVAPSQVATTAESAADGLGSMNLHHTGEHGPSNTGEPTTRTHHNVHT